MSIKQAKRTFCGIALAVVMFLFGCGGAQQTMSFNDDASTSQPEKPQKEAPPFLTSFDPTELTAQTLEVSQKQTEQPKRVVAFVRMGEWHVWWFPAVAGGTYHVVLTTLSGDADLFVYFPERLKWFPGIGYVRWLWSVNPYGLDDEVTFVTGQFYPYWVQTFFGAFQRRFIVVYGALPSTYQLVVYQL